MSTKVISAESKQITVNAGKALNSNSGQCILETADKGCAFITSTIQILRIHLFMYIS